MRRALGILLAALLFASCGGDCRDTGCKANEECLQPEEGGAWICAPERRP